VDLEGFEGFMRATSLALLTFSGAKREGKKVFFFWKNDGFLWIFMGKRWFSWVFF
jgi:hypothetical protein